MKTYHRLQHTKGGRNVQHMKKKIQNNQMQTLYPNMSYLLKKFGNFVPSVK